MPIEIEVDTLAQFTEALDSGAQIVLLDNMPPDMLRAAVELNKGRAVLEASGRVNEDTVVAIAESGVDYISVGALTHSALTLDSVWILISAKSRGPVGHYRKYGARFWPA